MVDGGVKPSAGLCHEDGSDLWISQGEPTRPLQLAFRVNSRAAVEALHAAALAAGGQDNGEPLTPVTARALWQHPGGVR
jgi:hypothetical protein